MTEIPKVDGATGTAPAPSQGATPVVPGQELILGRFKTNDDLAKSYQELERKMTQEAQTRAALERQLQEQALRDQARTATTPPPETNYDELFWQRPTEVIGKVVERFLSPFEEDRYQMQKTRFVQDPDFRKYEPQIDQMMSMQPELKRQPGSVEKMYRVLKALDFDQGQLEQQIRAKIAAEQQNKLGGAVEGASPTPSATPTAVQLSEEEARTAVKFFPELTPQEAYKRYADNKVKFGVGIRG